MKFEKTNAGAILFNDPALNINWMIEEPVVSEKDRSAKLFKEIDKDFWYR